MFPEDSPLLAAVAPYSSIEQLTGNSATYSFMPAGSRIAGDSPNNPDYVSVAWSLEERQIVRDTFDYISTLVDLSFTETTGANANLAFYEVPELGGNTAGFTEFLSAGRSNVVIGSDFTRPLAFNEDNVTVIHEIGHAIGLSHPFDGPARLPGVTDEDDKGDFGLNSEFVTRMSYIPGESPLHPGVDIWGEGATFGALDIAALQLLYGANTQTGLGNTTYGDTRQLQTIWDNGGQDRLDFSFAANDAVIDLRAATLMVDAGGGGYLSFVKNEMSLVGPGSIVADGGYTIAYGVVIEEALGGAGDDLITGNGANNLLTGNGGNDQIIGGDGLDTVFYSGNQQSYTLTLSTTGTSITDRRAGGDGIDTLQQIEALAFGDAAIAPFDLADFGGSTALSGAAMSDVVELYIAYFNRAPDALGLNFWGTAFANGTTLQQMATFFIDQPETRATYAADLSNADFATAVYGNVLGRAADQEGYEFWVGVLDAGSVSRDQFILAVLEGAKAAPGPDASDDFIAQQLADQQYLSTKTDIGTYYAITKGLSDVADASAAMALFDGSAAGINAARSQIDSFHTAALDAQTGDFLMPLLGVLEDPFAGIV